MIQPSNHETRKEPLHTFPMLPRAWNMDLCVQYTWLGLFTYWRKQYTILLAWFERSLIFEAVVYILSISVRVYPCLLQFLNSSYLLQT